MKGPRQEQTDELIKLYKEDNIYNFYVKDFDGNGQSVGRAERPIAAAASSSGSRGEHNTDMDVVSGAGVSDQAGAERSEGEYGEVGTGDPAHSAAEGREMDDEFQRPRSLKFHDEQMYPISKEEREEHELLGNVQYRSWCRHCAAARGVGQQHRQLREDPVDAIVPEIVLHYNFMGEEREAAPHIVVKDRKSNAYFSTSLDSKTRNMHSRLLRVQSKS